MFRTALLRTAVSASRVAARPVARRAIMSARAVVAPAPRLAAFKSVRMYSAASGLKKEEVEGRIMGILQGFDKVSYLCDTSGELFYRSEGEGGFCISFPGNQSPDRLHQNCRRIGDSCAWIGNKHRIRRTDLLTLINRSTTRVT